MKSLIAGAAAVAIAAVAAPAFAQDAGAPSFYGNLGYSYIDGNDVEFHAVQARVGARFLPYLGVEGEAGLGLGDDDVTIGGAAVEAKLKHTFNAYVVGFLPVQENVDLFARVGYGTTRLKATVAGVSDSYSADGVNYGGGVQFFFTEKDGVRAEYTKYDFNDGDGAANVWSLSYVRKF